MKADRLGSYSRRSTVAVTPKLAALEVDEAQAALVTAAAMVWR